MNNYSELLPTTASLRGPPALTCGERSRTSLSKGAKSSRTRRQNKNARRLTFLHIEKEKLTNYNKIMQNKPNLQNGQINASSFTTRNYANFRPPAHRKNEPNTNPILSTSLYIDQFEQKMQNEPNLKYPQINVNSFLTRYYGIFHPFQPRKNEPNTNPILPAILSIYAIACALGGKYLCVLACPEQRRWCDLGGLERKMQNEPNLKNAQINVTSFTAVNYANLHPLEHRKNEPNTNPILPVVLPTDCCWGLQFCRVCNLFAHAESYSSQDLLSSRPPAKTAYPFPPANKKMQNEPNLKKPHINVNSLSKINYANFHPLEHQKNEPNPNPATSDEFTRHKFYLQITDAASLLKLKINIELSWSMRYHKVFKLKKGLRL